MSSKEDDFYFPYRSPAMQVALELYLMPAPVETETEDSDFAPTFTQSVPLSDSATPQRSQNALSKMRGPYSSYALRQNMIRLTSRYSKGLRKAAKNKHIT